MLERTPGMCSADRVCHGGCVLAQGQVRYRSTPPAKERVVGSKKAAKTSRLSNMIVFMALLNSLTGRPLQWTVADMRRRFVPYEVISPSKKEAPLCPEKRRIGRQERPSSRALLVSTLWIIIAQKHSVRRSATMSIQNPLVRDFWSAFCSTTERGN